MSTRTIYQGARGYGWVDLEGEIATGIFHDSSLHWECTRNLNHARRANYDHQTWTLVTFMTWWGVYLSGAGGSQR